MVLENNSKTGRYYRSAIIFDQPLCLCCQIILSECRCQHYVLAQEKPRVFSLGVLDYSSK